MRTVLGAYEGQAAPTRAHVAVRALTAPFDELVDLVPPAGDVLDLGCGHGVLSLLLAVTSPDRRVLGVDPDAAKIRAATAAAARIGLSARVRFERVDPDRMPTGEHDAVVIADVLYLLGAQEATGLLRSVASHLRPGGVVVVKEMADRPVWKRAVAQLQERISVQVLRITRGRTVELLDEATIVDGLESAGLRARRVDLGRRRLHPHVAWVGASERPRGAVGDDGSAEPTL